MVEIPGLIDKVLLNIPFGNISLIIIAVQGLQNLGLRQLTREGSLSYHTCYDTGPRCSRFHLKDRPFSRLLRQARDNEEHTHPDSHARNGILGIKY